MKKREIRRFVIFFEPFFHVINMNLWPMQKLKELVPGQVCLNIQRSTIACQLAKTGGDFFQESSAPSSQIRTNLDGTTISGKLDALSRILAMASVGTDISKFFPGVLKQLFVSDPQVKRLCHLCLKLFADKHPDIVLLCVNAIQRDGADIEPLVRGLSIRTACSIRSKEVSAGALSALHKSSTDSAVYVRKCAAMSVLLYCAGISRFEDSDRDEVIGILDRLLGDSEPTVISATLMAMWKIGSKDKHFMTRALEVFHHHFVNIAALLPSIDPFGQWFGIHVFREYSVRNFSKNSKSDHFSGFANSLRQIARYSLSPPVVQVAVSVLSDLDLIGDLDTEAILARQLTSLSPELIDIFLRSVTVKRIKPFLVNIFTDSEDVKLKKLAILSRACTERNAKFLLSETLEYVKSAEGDSVVQACVSLIVKIGREHLHDPALQALLSLIPALNRTVSNEAVQAVRALISGQRGSEQVMKKTCIYLASVVEFITSPLAKASAIWLITLCHDAVPIVAPNVLRALARKLSTEEPLVKLELSVLASKVFAFHEKNSTSSSPGQVPSAVSIKLLPLLRELVTYIIQTSERDAMVGSLVAILSKVPVQEQLNRLSRTASSADPSTSSAYVEIFGDHGTLSRPVEDSPETLRVPKKLGKPATQEVKSLSSDQSGTNRNSNSVSVPTSMKHPAPKAATTLQDLELFFVASGSPDVPNITISQQVLKVKSPSSLTKKATLDLTGADWLQS